MSPKKLTDDDKQEILKLYRQTPETTSTLADRYGVSSSTISRFLKNTLSEQEYEELIQKKRLARTNKYSDDSEEPAQKAAQGTPTLVKEDVAPPEPDKPTLPSEKPSLDVLVEENVDETKIIPSKPEKPKIAVEKPVLAIASDAIPDEEDEEDLEGVDVITLGEMLGEDLEGEDEDWDGEDEEDEEEGEDEDYEQSLSGEGDIQVLPLSDAIFPRTCYLVIDRTAELIVRPLKEFAHLGQIPVEEIQQKTLPVFDNHRVARRFSNRSQRVIKVPDGRLLYKTCAYLYAKGITRLLMDGQIYSLAINPETLP